MSMLYEYLKSADLEKFFPVFEAHGVTDKSILALTMQDYALFGVTSMHDRKRLFQMIQVLKMDSEPKYEQQQPSMDNQMTSEESCERRTRGSSTPVKSSIARANPLGRQNQNMMGGPPPKGNQFPSAGGKFSEISTDDGGSQPSSRAVSRDSTGGVTTGRKSSNTTTTRGGGGGYNYGVGSAATSCASPGRSSARTDIGDRIEVCVRKRPLSKKEIRNEETDIASKQGRNGLVITEPKIAVDLTKYEQKHEFIFDHVFDENATNERIYRTAVRKLVLSVFNKGKATCFAYGQTGSGKTYTMMGNSKIKGMYLLAAKDIFNMLQNEEHSNLEVHVGFFEIYCGQLFDLLHDRKLLHPREDHKKRVCIAGLQEVVVKSANELMQVMNHGNSCRSTGSNSTNNDSSRSHAILQIELKTPEGRGRGKISFIDLAGSERAADTKESDKQTRMEGAEINQSLLALKECIRALDQVQKHTPFRQSKLTQVLRDSLIGQNARTCMIANISPNSLSGEHTLNTLRYAYRVKELKKSDANNDDEVEEEFEYEEEEFAEEVEGNNFNERLNSTTTMPTTPAANSTTSTTNKRHPIHTTTTTINTPNNNGVSMGITGLADVPSPAGFPADLESATAFQNGLMEEEIPTSALMYDEDVEGENSSASRTEKSRGTDGSNGAHKAAPEHHYSLRSGHSEERGAGEEDDGCTDSDIIEDIQFVKDQALSLIGSHKKQLSQVTEFCKQEMKMLYDLELTVGTAPVQGGAAAASETILALGEYAESVSQLLKDKMDAIKAFRRDIDRVCTSFTGGDPAGN